MGHTHTQPHSTTDTHTHTLEILMLRFLKDYSLVINLPGTQAQAHVQHITLRIRHVCRQHWLRYASINSTKIRNGCWLIAKGHRKQRPEQPCRALAYFIRFWLRCDGNSFFNCCIFNVCFLLRAINSKILDWYTQLLLALKLEEGMLIL